jgi:hypothetical protein
MRRAKFSFVSRAYWGIPKRTKEDMNFTDDESKEVREILTTVNQLYYRLENVFAKKIGESIICERD